MVTRYHLGRPLDEPKFGGVGSVEIDQSFFRVFHEFRRRHVPFAVGGTCSTAHYFPSKPKSSFCSGPGSSNVPRERQTDEIVRSWGKSKNINPRKAERRREADNLTCRSSRHHVREFRKSSFTPLGLGVHLSLWTMGLQCPNMLEETWAFLIS